MKGPLITIVMPTYNYARFLPEAIESVLAQTYQHFDLIIVDDGSLDNTREVVNEYGKKDRRIMYIRREVNEGIGSALNLGFEFSDGEYETWLASDNKIYPQMLEWFVGYLNQHQDVDFVYSTFDIAIMGPDGFTVDSFLKGKETLDLSFSPEKLEKGYILGMCWLWRREVRERAGNYQLEPGEDYDMALRLLERGCRFAYIPEPLGWYRYHNANVTHQVWKTDDPEKWTYLVKDKARARGYIREKKSKIGPCPDRLKVLIINKEFDCAGVGWDLKMEMLKHSTCEVKHVAKTLPEWAPLTDKLFWHVDQIKELLDWADVLHFNQWIWTMTDCDTNNAYTVRDKPEENPFEPWLHKKHVVFHFHGGLPQLDPEYFIAECRRVGASMLKCDPFTQIHGAKWLPNVLDLEAVKPNEDYRKLRTSAARIAIAMGPGDKRRLNEYLAFALNVIRPKYGFEYRFFEGMPKRKCLDERTPYPISIDNTTQGFIGMWGWESLAMGQILIARLDPEVKKAYDTLGPGIPICNTNNIDEVIKYVRFFSRNNVASLEMRTLAREWMVKYYNAKRIVDMYVDFYRGLYV